MLPPPCSILASYLSALLPFLLCLLYLNRQLDPHGHNNLACFVFGIFCRTPRDGPSALLPPSRTGSFISVCTAPIIQILGVPIGSESLEPEYLAETCLIIRKDFLFPSFLFFLSSFFSKRVGIGFRVTGAEKRVGKRNTDIQDSAFSRCGDLLASSAGARTLFFPWLLCLLLR